MPPVPLVFPHGAAVLDGGLLALPLGDARKRGYLYILLAAMIYSTTEVALKGLGGVFAPMQITVERVLIGALFLLPFALRSLRRNAIRLTRRKKQERSAASRGKQHFFWYAFKSEGACLT